VRIDFDGDGALGEADPNALDAGGRSVRDSLAYTFVERAKRWRRHDGRRSRSGGDETGSLGAASTGSLDDRNRRNPLMARLRLFARLREVAGTGSADVRERRSGRCWPMPPPTSAPLSPTNWPTPRSG